MTHLTRLTSLQFLNLDGTMITDAGLSQLSGLSGLKTLFLDATKITDVGMQHVLTVYEARALEAARYQYWRRRPRA